MDYGKFNSAEELLKGYIELEKSFTQKCQQLSQLQKQQGTSESVLHPDDLSSPQTTEQTDSATLQEQPPQSEVVPTDAQLQQYLERNPKLAIKLLSTHEAPPTAPTVITGGGTMSLALPSKPKSIKEATLMAQKLFVNQ